MMWFDTPTNNAQLSRPVDCLPAYCSATVVAPTSRSIALLATMAPSALMKIQVRVIGLYVVTGEPSVDETLTLRSARTSPYWYGETLLTESL